jgi:hypothetical protein
MGIKFALPLERDYGGSRARWHSDAFRNSRTPFFNPMVDTVIFFGLNPL